MINSSEEYNRLFQLNNSFEWLKPKSKELFELWELLENENQKLLITELINKFLFLNNENISYACQAIINQITKIWNLSHENTFLISSADSSEADGSQFVLYFVKRMLPDNWGAFNQYNNIITAAHEIPINGNYVIIDDFIGTGTTMLARVNYLDKILKQRESRNSQFYIVSTACMQFAKEKLAPYLTFSPYYLKKGISEHFEGEKLVLMKSEMKKIEKKLFNNKNRFNFGYKKSEALISIMDLNTPNNVFPIFWYPKLICGKKRNPIFIRK